MPKNRKPLNDALATNFVYGDQPITQSASEGQKPSIMDKLQSVEPKEPTKRFTVDLSESVHRKLSILAAKTGRSKADIVRTLLDDVLQKLSD